LAGALSAKAAHKARHFIEICDSFHIPLIFLADCPGVMPGFVSEREGTLRVGLSVAYASSFVQVPTVTVVLRKAFGFGGTSMGAIGSDQALVIAWPSASFASLPARGGVAASKNREIAESEDPEKARRELIRAHEEKQGPLLAAGSFRIDDVIDPRETRPLIIKVLEIGRRRRVGALGPRYKHGIMP
jgi:acetyl-CoA carboxylase carboxyltransferase component